MLLCEDMFDIVNGLVLIVFGDFKLVYIIVECFDLCVLCDFFLVKLYVFFYVIKCVGGGVIDVCVIKLMVFG